MLPVGADCAADAGVSDHMAIAALLYRYAELVDDGDFDGVAKLFAHATLTVEGSDDSCHGYVAARRMFETRLRLYPGGIPRTQHLVSNVVVNVDEAGATASSRCYYTVFQATEALALQPIIAGSYHDRFERANGFWRFSHRHMIRELIGNLDEHLLVDLNSSIAMS